MKRIALLALALALIAALVMGISTALAAKPQNVIEKSNGFPSGEHFNLNIHGKADNFVCDATPGGGSVFVDQYGPATIQYVVNKKSSVGNLTVLDPCAVDGGTATVQLPYEAQGYYVFARILGKPNNGKSGNESSIILYPNVVVQACNDDPLNPDPNFGNYTSCDDALWALGLIVGSNVYAAEPQGFVRFDPAATPGKGNSRGTDITPLFTYSGWAGNQTEFDALDINDDGQLTNADVPGNLTPYEPAIWDYDADSNDVIDINEWLNFAADELGIGTYYHEEWIFNIADLVVTDQQIKNDGTKLLQIRFYPVDTTEFIAQ
jgi:hypothetical protein